MEEARRVIGIDIGNSGLRIAELDLVGQRIGRRRRVSWEMAARTSGTDEPRFAPDSVDWLPSVQQFLDLIGGSGAASCKGFQWLVSSVRRDAAAVLERFVRERVQSGATDHWQSITRHNLPLKVDVLEPDRVGIDRLLAATAAANLFVERPLIVMQVGSAMTVDLLAAPNVFTGGAILPGVPMMLRLLGQAADLLPEIDAEDLTDLPELPGRNTEQAMLCGTSSALIGGAKHLVERYREAFGEETPVVLSGGDGNRLLLHIPAPVHVIPDLVLQGLLFAGR